LPTLEKICHKQAKVRAWGIILIKKSLLWCLCLWFVLAAGEANPSASFNEWLDEFKQEALDKGIRGRTLDKAFHQTKFMPNIIRFDTTQAEKKETFRQYIDKRLPPRIARAIRKQKKHAQHLKKISKVYGVASPIIVALWGIESNFGKDAGKYNVIHSLATLAFDGRRSQFFRSELLEALKILDMDKMPHRTLTGSWAGALGHCQFMPSSYNRYAIDGDGKGFSNIWEASVDLFGSIANYLQKEGWKGDEPWGMEVKLPENFDKNMANLSIGKSTEEWSALGVRQKDGSHFAYPQLKGSIVIPDGGDHIFLVYNNFRVILKWNRSVNFALSVCLLADEIGAAQ
jgi:membrane-bound lytic murein transglycosylase B